MSVEFEWRDKQDGIDDVVAGDINYLAKMVLACLDRTPKKGIDYWTEEDKAELVEETGEYIRNREIIKEYGVRWEGTESTQGIRLGDAVGLFAGIRDDITPLERVKNDFDYIYPWSDMKLCNVDNNGYDRCFVGNAFFEFASDDKETMVYIPKFYYKTVKINDNGGREIWICGSKKEGYELHPAFYDNGVEIEALYVGAYHMGYDSSHTFPRSISGVDPIVNVNRAECRTLARSKGDIWGIENISVISAIQMLMLVEFASMDIQSYAGSGVIVDTAVHKSGETDGLGGYSGFVGSGSIYNPNDGKVSISYRGIENFYGNIHRFIDGVNFNGSEIFVSNSMSDYADETYDGTYTKAGYLAPTTDGWVRSIGYDADRPWLMLPTNTDATYYTYVGDHAFCKDAECVLFFGGNYNYSRGAGIFSLSNFYGKNSATDWHGARLIAKKKYTEEGEG